MTETKDKVLEKIDWVVHRQQISLYQTYFLDLKTNAIFKKTYKDKMHEEKGCKIEQLGKMSQEDKDFIILDFYEKCAGIRRVLILAKYLHISLPNHQLEMTDYLEKIKDVTKN